MYFESQRVSHVRLCSQINKFQAMLTTDGVKSFVVYRYNNILWSISINTRIYAMVSEIQCMMIAINYYIYIVHGFTTTFYLL